MVNQPRTYKKASKATGATGRRPKNSATKRTVGTQSGNKMSMNKMMNTKDPDLARYYQILRDPFSPGPPVAYPDQFRGLSIAASLKSQFYMPSNTAKTAGALWIRPSLVNFRQNIGDDATFEALTYQSTYVNHSDYTSGMNLNSTCNRWRPLVIGVKVSSVGRNDDIAGRINFTIANENINSTNAADWPDLHAHSGSFNLSKRGHVITLRNFDHPRFIGDTSVGTDYTNRVYLAYSGDPSEILIETILHCEIVPKPDSAIADTAVVSYSSRQPPGTPMVTSSVQAAPLQST